MTYRQSDTGYRATDKGQVCPAFKRIGERFGSIDLALIPIWRGGMLSSLSKVGVRVKRRPSHNSTRVPG